MWWIIGFSLATLMVILALAYGVFLLINKKKPKFPPVVILMGLVYLGGFFSFYPMYLNMVAEDHLSFIEALVMALHNAIRLFVLDGDFAFFADIAEPLNEIGTPFRTAYHTVTIILFISAPILSATAVLSLVINFVNLNKFNRTFNKEVFIFSELNIKSLNLARSIKNNRKKAKVVFCDVTDQTKEEFNDLYEEATELRAIILKVDITALTFRFHSKDKNKGVHFFIISENDEKNLYQYSSLLKSHKGMGNSKIYLFSRSAQSDLLFNQYDSERKIACRKYDTDFLIIYNYLYERGIDLFNSAKDKKISVLIVGLGLNGKMLTKALAWFCQMDGYELEINAFDSDPNARSKFEAEAPELLNPAFAHPKNPQENQFVINIHDGLDVATKEFNDEIEKIAGTTTAAFTCLGNDEMNLQTAIKLRMLFERQNNKAHIISVVYSGNKDFIKDVKNFKGQDYNIECIGSYENVYSYHFIIDSELEKEAIEAHMRYSKTKQEEEAIFSYAYNFRSSCASVIHQHVRIQLDMNGAANPEQMTPEQVEATKVLEHRRWAAYTRSEGYIYAPIRNDLAKTHHDLILYSELSEEEKDKDAIVGIKK